MAKAHAGSSPVEDTIDIFLSMKNAILLAGGTGSRLFPLTHVVNKHLLGVDGKFIIDFPLNTLKQMGIENCAVVLGGNHFSQVVDHLKDGQNHGMNFNYVYQGEAKGIAQAINLCQRMVADNDKFVVILGDNIFSHPIVWNQKYLHQAQIVLHHHNEMQRFGVASLYRETGDIFKIEEKPRVLEPQYDQYAITGCYLFDNRFFHYFKKLKMSARGEYEIVDIIRAYHERGALYHTFTQCNSTQEAMWSDAGTHSSIAFVNDYFYQRKLNK